MDDTGLKSKRADRETRYRVISELVSDCAYTFRVEPDGTLSCEWVTGFTRITGFAPEEVFSQDGWQSLVHPDDLPAAKRHMAQLLAGEPSTGEFRVVSKGNKTQWLRDCGKPEWDEEQGRVVRIYGAMQDITTQKDTEQALRRSEAQYSGLFENNHTVMLFIDPKSGKILDANPSACAFYGYSYDVLVQKSITEINILSESEVFEEMERAKLAQSQQFFFRHRLANGEIRDVEVHSGPIMLRDKKVLYSIVQDVTERKRAEQKLHRVGRVLKMLSECNHAVLRAATDPELLEEVCRIIVEVGGYRMAWVGFAVKDRAKSVQPAAQMGYEEGYLETLRLSWDPGSERGRGPTGIAIRTGKPCIVKDIAHNPKYGPWREEAIRRGYASTIGLPLVDHERAFGVLNIYDTNPDVFDEQEVALLVELANDLAYGVRSLRARAERARVEQALRRERDRAQRYLDIAGVMLIVLNRQGEITLINKKGCRILEWGEDELLGANWFETCLPPRVREEARDVFRQLMARKGGRFEYYECPVLTKAGEERTIAWHNTVLTDELGYIVSYLGSGEDVTERRRTEAAIRRKNAQLIALTRQLDQVEDAERKRLARELHDQVGQSLTALGINLNIVRDQLPGDAELAQACMSDSLLLLEQVTENIRNVITDLRSPVLDDYGLVAALRWYGTQFQNRSGIVVDVPKIDLDPRPSPHIENALFRIVQEALTNVSKHAQASFVAVRVRSLDGVLKLIIEDDGVGFDPSRIIGAEGHRGWGVLIMMERAEAVGGRCHVEAQPGHGTKVIVEVAQ